MTICTGCGLLCDDITLEIKDSEILNVHNACIRGSALFLNRNNNRIMTPTIDGEECEYGECLDRAADLLMEMDNPVIFGMDSSTIEAQETGIELGRVLGGYLDDTSTFCHGSSLEMLYGNNMPSCTLDDVRNFADVVVFWGTDPMNTYPRHLSRFSYYPRGEKRQKGWETDRKTIAIDVLDTDTSSLCDYFMPISPGGDLNVIKDLTSVFEGVMRTSNEVDLKLLMRVSNELKKAEYGVIFIGLGLLNSLKYDLSPLSNFMELLNSHSEFYCIPMSCNFGMRSMTKLIYDITGHVNRIRFINEEAVHDPEYAFPRLLEKKAIDGAVLVGSNPLGGLPLSLSRELLKIPCIALDPRATETTRISTISLPVALSGVECGGKTLRMDGVSVELNKIVDSPYLTDHDVLNGLLERVS